MAESHKADPGKYDRLRNVLDTLSKPTAFELGVVRALHDIHRRVIEEPWFGRTVHDVVSFYNQRLGEEHEKEQEPAREPVQHNVQQNEQQNTQEQGHDYSPDVLYGRDQATTERQQERDRQEQQRTQERGRDIER